MQKLARLAIRRRWLVIVAWLAFIFIAQGIAGALGGANYKDSFSLPGTETQTVMNLLKHSGQKQQTGLSGQVVMHTKTGTLETPPANVVSDLQNLCRENFKVTGVTSPWGSYNCAANGKATPAPPQPTQLSQDKTIAIVNVNWYTDKYDQKLFDGVYDALKPLNSSTLQVEFTGDGFQGQGQKESGVNPVVLGFIAALIILAIVFRTVGATALPLASAIAALSSGLGLIAILSHAMNVSNITPQLSELMVIGVGIDYALFIVTRHRRNLRRGMSVPDSIVASINTSGRAVLFAGSTVCVAMLGLTLLGVSFFYGLAIGTAIAVSLTMVASVTLLPALLSLLGLKVLPRAQRRAVRAGQFETGELRGFWARWAELVARRKVVTGVIGAAIMIALAIPFLSMRLGHADQGNDRASTTTRKGYDLIAQGFGKGYNSVLTLVVSGQNAPQTAGTVSTKLRTVGDVDAASVVTHKPLTPTLNLISFKSVSAPQDEATTNLVNRLRNDVLPSLYQGTPDRVYVYGQTAIYVDFAKVLSDKLPLFITAVVGLSFLLLLVAFRSLVVPLTAAAMNLLAAGASFGLVVAIFQWGWGSEALGIGKGAPIEAWAPVMFFAVLFGLSMDYQVFLVSRMHEEWVHTGDNRRAVTVGQAETGGIITAAALIMITVFFGFVLDPNRAVKMLGIGLASAVFLDAFVLRTILVPSLMHVFGKANWFFPKALDRITPHISVDAEDAALAQRGGKPSRPGEPDEIYTRV
jgi:putative drug exporter of the RND superfamily